MTIARDCDVNTETVHGWAKTQTVPARHHAALVASAARHGIPLTAEELDDLVAVPPDERAA